MPLYLGPRSEHVRQYLRVVTWRRRVEDSRLSLDRNRREARILVVFTVAFFVLLVSGPGHGLQAWFTWLGLAILLVSEWRAWYRRRARARRRIALAEARLDAVRRRRA